MSAELDTSEIDIDLEILGLDPEEWELEEEGEL